MARRKAKTAKPPVEPVVEPVVETAEEAALEPTDENSISTATDSSPDSPSSGDGSVFFIAEGCALTGTKRGLLHPGDRVTVDDLRDGQEGFDRWMAAGFIVCKKVGREHSK